MPRRKPEGFSWERRMGKIFSIKNPKLSTGAVNYILFKGLNILSTENI
jgi:hypothetical protein